MTEIGLGMAHYSLAKAAGVLGIGNEQVIALDTDDHNRIDMPRLAAMIEEITTGSPRTRILAVVGIAGSTETGGIDPLASMARVCRQYGIHVHVDAAWGGPTLLSDRYRSLLKGIERADSVAIDGHKQFYMPMTCGMVFSKIPTYRLCPPWLNPRKQSDRSVSRRRSDHLNRINTVIQRKQREAGRSFVSRTTLGAGSARDFDAVVFRCVIMNPLTTPDILREILDEQERLFQRWFPAEAVPPNGADHPPPGER